MGFQDYPTALRRDSILIGRYIIQDVLGQGSFGITYKALDYQTNEQVAIKEYFPATLSVRLQDGSVLPREGSQKGIFEEGKKWFLEEVRTLSDFAGNPNIVRIYSYFEDHKTAYFSMEYVKGVSLTDYVGSRGGRIPWPEAWELLLPIMDALSSVHAKNIIHRDIKPDNIIISDGNNARILDFGAARFSYGRQSRSLDVILTRGFAPLEQYYRRGKQGPWTDVYGLGATMYSAITGEIPLDAVKRSYRDDLKSLSSLGVSIPDYAQNALLKALAVQAVERFDSMEDFKRAVLEASARCQGPEIEAERRRIEKKRLAAALKAGKGQSAADRAEREQSERLAMEQAERERRERLAREQAEREQRERLAREQAERERRERLAREQAERERLAREQADREQQEKIEKERLEKEKREKREKIIFYTAVVVLIIVVAVFLLRH